MTFLWSKLDGIDRDGQSKRDRSIWKRFRKITILFPWKLVTHDHVSRNVSCINRPPQKKEPRGRSVPLGHVLQVSGTDLIRLELVIQKQSKTLWLYWVGLDLSRVL